MIKLNRTTSTYLDILRILCAQLVLIGHNRSFLGLQAWARALYAPFVQSLAVSILFILSGFLTIYSAKNKPADYKFKDFFVNRFIRIYSVYLPALFFVLAVDELTITLVPAIVYNHPARSIDTFLCNVLMLQDFPFFRNFYLFSKTTFGSGLQLWTLPPEWFMYMMFGFFFYKLYSKKTKFRIPLCVFSLFCAIVPFANFVYGRGNGLSISWLVGVLIYYAFTSLKDREIPKNSIIWVAVLAFVAGILRIAGVKRNMGVDYDPLYTIDMAICILCGLLLTSRANREQLALTKPVKLIAGYSYSLYVTHYSVLIFMNALWQQAMNPILLSIIEFFVCNIVAYIFSLLFERHLPAWLIALWSKYRARASATNVT